MVTLVVVSSVENPDLSLSWSSISFPPVVLPPLYSGLPHESRTTRSDTHTQHKLTDEQVIYVITFQFTYAEISSPSCSVGPSSPTGVAARAGTE